MSSLYVFPLPGCQSKRVHQHRCLHKCPVVGSRMRATSLNQEAVSSMLVDGVLNCGHGTHAKRSLSQVVSCLMWTRDALVAQ
jgi:hypothetical protein